MAPSKTVCKHADIQFEPSPHAKAVRFQASSIKDLFKGATGEGGEPTKEFQQYAAQFPAPLVLPDDELSHNPDYEAQPVKPWFTANYRNRITSARHKIYVANVPSFDQESTHSGEIHSWINPRSDAVPKKTKLAPVPGISDVLEYMKAFFQGLPVLLLPDPLMWTEWLEVCRCIKNHGCKHSNKIDKIGLVSTGSGTVTRIRVRERNSEEHYSAYPAQLNLNDILDHMMAVLPADAYALLLLVDHDMYEDEEDDFCCGRAFGGSRVCVVSTAQYQPALDKDHGIDFKEGHWWPGSHCVDFVNRTCGMKQAKLSRKRAGTATHAEPATSTRVTRQTGRNAGEAIILDLSIVEDMNEPAVDPIIPLREAMTAHSNRLSKVTMSEEVLKTIYLRRVTLTASHELLHCFGFDHCVYRACAMQGTACIAEDSRQPPYLCPVCENKLARAILQFSERKKPVKFSDSDWSRSQEILRWKKSRHEAIASFCDVRGGDENVAFCALHAWTNAVLQTQGSG